MKNLIMFFVLVMVMVFSSYEVSYSQNVETGNFYFLVGTEGNERAIMYLYVIGTNAHGSYYTKEQDIGFSGSFDGKNLKLGYGGEWNENRSETINKKYITGTLSGDIVFRGKHNSKNVNLSLANAPVNTMKIFHYIDDIIDWDDTTIIYPKDYNERKLINDYKSEIKEYEYSEFGVSHWGTQSIEYIDDKIIIIRSSFSEQAGGHPYGGVWFHAYNINSKFEYKNEIKLSDFIENTKDRRLLSLIRDKFYQYYNSDDFQGGIGVEEYDLDSLIAEEGGVENYSFLISPQGTIKILFAPYNSYYIEYLFEATFTFEEIKPFIKKGSPLDYLFN